jgi:hypothetical protein
MHFDLEMQRALEADGEKLRQLTGEDHGPYFIADETAFAPCPCCFESSGYVWEHGNDWESGPWSNQTNIPCSFCNGTGLVPCDEPTTPDDREDDYAEDGYVRALDAALAKAGA